jgi:uncharacterized protein
MAEYRRKNGYLEIKFNEDRTQALATIYPPSPDGVAVYADEVVERLKGMGVTYGVREQAIRDAIRYVAETAMAAAHVVVAQGAVPQAGQDARVHYSFPLDLLSKPLPKRSDGVTDWFSIDPGKLVTAGKEIATIVPAQPGTPGKTLTWPIQTIAAPSGKPVPLHAGQNVRLSDDGLRMLANADGYICLHNDTLNLTPLRIVTENLMGGEHSYPSGAVLMECAQNASIRTGGILAIRGVVKGCRLRADGDVFLQYAEDCEIITTGNVYVTRGLKNCAVNSRKQLRALESAHLMGGTLCASTGVSAVELGTPDFTMTEVQVGIDRFSEVRACEIEEEIAACEANIARIRLTLKPFASLTVHTNLPDDKRALVQKLQEQQKTQEARINILHNERRALAIAAKEKIAAEVTVSKTAHPGVLIGINKAAFQVESPLAGVRFIEDVSGKSVLSAKL